MGKVCIPSTHEHRVRKPQATPGPQAGSGLPIDASEGARCPRLSCGGLVVLRGVVTVDGSCDELVCSLCARSRVLRVREPYRPMAQSRDPDVEGLLALPSQRAGHVGRGSDHTLDIGLPPDVLASAGLDTGCSDESLLDVPPSLA